MRTSRPLTLALLWLWPSYATGQDNAWHAALSAQPASVAQMRQQAGDTSRVLESDHFVLVYTAREALARDLAQQLEGVYQAHRRFAADLHLPTRPPAHKLEVLVFDTYDEFKAHLAASDEPRADLLGGYVPAANRTAFFDLDTYPALTELQAAVERAEPAQRDKLRARLQSRRATLYGSVIRHEAAHQVQVNLGLLPALERVPNWLAEGLATLFEPTSPSGDAPPRNSYRLYEFKSLYSAGPPALADVRRLLTDEEAWCGGKCYPLAWALVRLLYDQRPAALTRLLREVAAGPLPNGVAARAAFFDELFGPVDESWVARLYTATMGLPLDSGFGRDRNSDPCRVPRPCRPCSGQQGKTQAPASGAGPRTPVICGKVIGTRS